MDYVLLNVQVVSFPFIHFIYYLLFIRYYFNFTSNINNNNNLYVTDRAQIFTLFLKRIGLSKNTIDSLVCDSGNIFKDLIIIINQFSIYDVTNSVFIRIYDGNLFVCCLRYQCVMTINFFFILRFPPSSNFINYSDLHRRSAVIISVDGDFCCYFIL